MMMWLFLFFKEMLTFSHNSNLTPEMRSFHTSPSSPPVRDKVPGRDGSQEDLHVSWCLTSVGAGSLLLCLRLLRNDERWFIVIRGHLVARVKRLSNSTAVMNRLFCNVYDLIANSFLRGRQH